jgi:hypothetical protein
VEAIRHKKTRCVIEALKHSASEGENVSFSGQPSVLGVKRQWPRGAAEASLAKSAQHVRRTIKAKRPVEIFNPAVAARSIDGLIKLSMLRLFYSIIRTVID